MLIYLSLAWLAGLFLGRFSAWPVWSAGLVISGFLIWWGFRSGQRPWPAPARVVGGLCLMLFIAASLRYQASLTPTHQPSLAAYNDRGTVEVLGVVDRDPELKQYGLELRLRATEIKAAGQWQPVSGAALLRAERFASYPYGSQLRVRGKLETPPQFPQFNYREYLARQGVNSIMNRPQVEVVAVGQGHWLLERIYSLRQRLATSLARSLPEPQAALAQGILLGLRGNIPPELNQAFVQSGTTHILAISGQNISVVAGILLGLLVWALGRRRPTYFILAVAILWLYALLTGGQPPVIRGTIMASLFLTADYLGRPGSAATALALAAAVMAGISPDILRDVSFQLSFLSMAGLVYLAPSFQALGQRARLPLPVAMALAVSVGAILATWPVIAYDFGRVSLVGLPATALGAAALPAIIVTSAMAAMLGLVMAPLGMALGWVAWLPLSYLIWVAQGFAALPAASLSVQSFPPALVGGYYAILAGAVLAISRRQRLKTFLSQKLAPRLRNGAGRLAQSALRTPILRSEKVSWKWLSFILAPVTALVWIAIAWLTVPAGGVLSSPKGGRLQVSFLDVGQGEAILIQTPSRHRILIDGGGSGHSLSLALGRKLPFWERRLDLVVLTSPREERVAGLVEVVARYRVGQAWEPGPPQRPGPAYQEWQRRITKTGIPSVAAEKGLKLTEGGYLVLEVLYPQDWEVRDRKADADKAAVLRLSLGEVSFLFTSDIGEMVERQLLTERANVESRVLQVARHGGAGATSEAFLARVNPAAAVISVGAKDWLGRPSEEVVKRLRQPPRADRVYLTRDHGTIDFFTDGRRLWVGTER